MRRNVQVSLLVLSLAALLIVGGTMAWFTASADDITNTFKAGTVQIELHEDFAGATNVNPGDCYDKVVYVENTGSKRAFVRVQLVEKWEDADGEIETTDNIAQYEIGQDWIKEGDWYYYKEALEIDEDNSQTSPIIEKVCFAGKEMGNEFQGATFTLTAKAEAIQVTNNAAYTEWIPNPGVSVPVDGQWDGNSSQES